MSNEPAIDLKDILEYLKRTRGMPRLATAVDDCVKACFKREKADSWTFERYVRHCYAKDLLGKIRKATSWGEDPESPLQVDDLAEFIRRVRMPPAGLLAGIGRGAPCPFENFRQGCLVRVCVAKRMGKNTEGGAKDADWERAVHGSRDVLAVVDLINILGRHLRLEYSWI